jgi:hypothetical protein
MTLEDLHCDSLEKATSVMIYTLSTLTREPTSYQLPYFLGTVTDNKFAVNTQCRSTALAFLVLFLSL